MRKYRLIAKKGEGTFSEVIKAQNIKTGNFHAIKCMKSSYKNADQVRMVVPIELRNLFSSLHHKPARTYNNSGEQSPRNSGYQKACSSS